MKGWSDRFIKNASQDIGCYAVSGNPAEDRPPTATSPESL